MRFRLRHGNQDLALPQGEFSVGRSAACQLSLDDPLVSRRHAVLFVTPESLSVEDLASRNGVLINGKRITGLVVLSVGDRLLIGNQELVVRVDALVLDNDTISAEMRAGVDVVSPEEAFRSGDADGFPSPAEANTSSHGEAFEMLVGVADKALAMGRAEEAERLVATGLADVLNRSRRGAHPAVSVVDASARFAAKLASATGKGSWVDYVVELYASEERPCPGLVIEELYAALRRVNEVDLAGFRAYTSALRAKLPAFGPAEKFLFQRLEGLERLAALR